MQLSIKVKNPSKVPLRLVVKQLPEFSDAETTIASGQSGELVSNAGRESLIMIGTSGIEQTATVEIVNLGDAPVGYRTPHQFGNASGVLDARSSIVLNYVCSKTQPGGAAAGVIRVKA